MYIKKVFCAIMAMTAAAVYAETVKGIVDLNMYPGLEDIALAYERSEHDDLRKVALELIESRGEDRKKVNIANKAVVALQSLSDFKTIRQTVVGGEGNFVTAIYDTDPDCRVFAVMR